MSVVFILLEQQGHKYKNQIVVIVTLDNLANVLAILKGTSKSEIINQELKRLYEIAASYNIILLADWIPRQYNGYADDLSKYAITLKN